MLKELIDNFIRKYSTIHVAGKVKNLLVISAPRSGSTWLVEILGASDKIKLIREPLNLRKPAVVKDLGISSWVDLYQESNRTAVISYLRGFIDGSSRAVGHKRDKPFTKTWHFLTNRAVYKILHGAEAWMEELRKELNGELIFLIRHPIAVSLSRNFLPRLEAFLDSDYSKHFSERQLAVAREILNSGTFLQKATLDWCFQNALALRMKSDDVLVITYEELTLRTPEMLKFITQRFDLDLSADMINQINRPSGSSSKSTVESQAMLNKLSIKSDKMPLIEKWKGKVSEQEEQEVFRILSVFDINIYHLGSFLPRPEYMLLGEK